MEFFGPGVANLSMDYRSGIDVMTTETTCLSSVWAADDTLKDHLAVLGRGEEFKPQAPADGAYYDGVIEVELDQIRPMIALPFHPSNAYTIQEFKENMDELLHQVDEDTVRQLKLKNQPASLREKIVDGKFMVDQGVIAGCSGGTYQNIVRAAQILDGHAIGSGEFWLSVYPTSQPVNLELTRKGYIASLMAAGASIRSCFCGPCFGAGDVPANGGFSIRHSTRNFPNREGSKPSDGQVSYVALMDARSIAATALNGGVLTGADELPDPPADPAVEPFAYDDTPYKARVYFGVGKADPSQELVFGPNIADWPEQVALPENLLLTVCSAIYDPVTTTDELIPSGETSSYRSNPIKLSDFALSRKDPQYVPRAKEVLAVEKLRRTNPDAPEVKEALMGHDGQDTGLGSLVMALKPGDGSAREQAASCQRVLGGVANLCAEYRHQALPLQRGQLGHAALHRRGREGLEHPARRQALPARHPRCRGLRRGGDLRHPHPERRREARHPQAARHDPGRAGHRAGRLPDQLLRQVRCPALPRRLRRTKRFATGKTLMPAEFSSAEQIKSALGPPRSVLRGERGTSCWPAALSITTQSKPF